MTLDPVPILSRKTAEESKMNHLIEKLEHHIEEQLSFLNSRLDAESSHNEMLYGELNAYEEILLYIHQNHEHA